MKINVQAYAYTQPYRKFSSVHLQINPLVPEPCLLPVLQEQLERPVINHEEPHKCSAFISLTLKHSSPNESAGNYCSSAALQSTRCQYTRVECTNVQKKETLSHQLEWPPALGRQRACRVSRDGEGVFWAAPYLQELFHLEGAVVPLSVLRSTFWWLFWAETTLLIPPKTREGWSSLGTVVLLFVFFSLNDSGGCWPFPLCALRLSGPGPELRALAKRGFPLTLNPAPPWADVSFCLHVGQDTE